MAERAPLTALQLAVLTGEDLTHTIRPQRDIKHGIYRSLRLRGLIYRVGDAHRLTADGAAAVAIAKAARLEAERLAVRNRELAARMRSGRLDAVE